MRTTPHGPSPTTFRRGASSNSDPVLITAPGSLLSSSSEQVRLQVRAAAGASAGAQGVIEYSAEATGGPDGTLVAPEDSAKTVVTVGSAPDLGVSTPRDVKGVAPGTGLTVPFSVTNTGDETAHGFQVRMWATYGLDIVTRYPQCTYTEPADDAEYTPMTIVTCSFDTDVAPGATVKLPEPLRITVTGHALYERFDYEVRPGGGATDLDDSDNYHAWQIGAANTADLAVHGTEVSGAAGDTVTAAFGFVDRGPAWVANAGSGDAVAVIDFYLPEGTTAASVPDACFDARRPGEAVGHYACALPMWVKPDVPVSFPFQLRVDRVVPDATGRVVARPAWGTTFPFDPNSENNSAQVVLNPSA
ncbi:COG1361 family protein [Streptomyces cellulosae]|uniref:CARDB domain-containing protein n=1 Tax=Streptomyces cellulosae TaxID=1968 RepID=A0ABW7Y2M6_STRCE